MADSRGGAGKGQGGPGTSHVKKQGCAQGLMNVKDTGASPKGLPTGQIWTICIPKRVMAVMYYNALNK